MFPNAVGVFACSLVLMKVAVHSVALKFAVRVLASQLSVSTHAAAAALVVRSAIAVQVLAIVAAYMAPLVCFTGRPQTLDFAHVVIVIVASGCFGRLRALVSQNIAFVSALVELSVGVVDSVARINTVVNCR